jgi:hypothetical protein
MMRRPMKQEGMLTTTGGVNGGTSNKGWEHRMTPSTMGEGTMMGGTTRRVANKGET